MSMVDAFEKIPVTIYPDSKKGSKFIAGEIAALIREKQSKGEKCVLGLATGSSPKALYAELVRLHKEEGLSFKNVISVNLDEYYPIDKTALQSYNRFMKFHLLDLVDIDPANIFIPNGEIKKEDVKAYCLSYEQKIEELGGIDLQLLGIGNNGHIGFNEPGSSIYSKTRLVTLDTGTRIANAYEFPNISLVPRLALTMGISSIFKAKRVLLMAWGQGKAPVVQKAVEDQVTEQIPASLLQQHNDCLFILDEDAASELTRFKSPWLTGELDWTPKMIRKAVIGLSLKLGKPLLSLTNNDYRDGGLSDLLVEAGDAYETNLQVYYMMRDS
ncbi:MAG: glucosamine-6-phosphate deaminase, partial [Chitinophagaceae bacterium]